jgi:hypothetical protein
MASVVVSISDCSIWKAMISKVKAVEGALDRNLLAKAARVAIGQWIYGE